jgi:hypothetical protein
MSSSEIAGALKSVFRPIVSFSRVTVRAYRLCTLCGRLHLYTGSRPFRVSISDRHSERLSCQYLEKGREIASQTLIASMKS